METMQRGYYRHWHRGVWNIAWTQCNVVTTDIGSEGSGIQHGISTTWLLLTLAARGLEYSMESLQRGYCRHWDRGIWNIEWKQCNVVTTTGIATVWSGT